jgi:glyoxylase-like metal-dependent hydrolase (beta-lactamase superfamily II)
MLVRRLVLGELETNCWVVADGLGGPAVVIDPAADAEAILDAVGELKVSAVALTHKHFDHLGAARELLSETGAPLLVHAVDAPDVTDPVTTQGAIFGFMDTAPAPDRELADGDVIEAGQLRLIVLHTPGHTPGGISLFAEDPSGGPPHLFSGDTLFAGSVGRSDFPGGDARALSTSIARKLAGLPADTIVHPGHGPDTTIGRERRGNPYFPRA